MPKPPILYQTQQPWILRVTLKKKCDDTYFSTRRHNKSATGTRLVKETNISTIKAAKICNQWSEMGIDIPDSSQQGIYKALFKKSGEMKKHLIDTLRNQKWSLHFGGKHIEGNEWSLHFGGKHIEGNEYQAVFVKNERDEIKLAVLKLCGGKAETIAEGLKSILDEFHL
ncbi:Hypothetical predicted protein [Octopus vulgaris]|uniref:Uncharacterized protein n=1 Tax=Octopus vulgaris TaxID=6645 RepID=A0AA36AKH7_OCTVU|nr:Hypothetical predicted protein [Octopus vulgaris]